ncbi:hypothetical protein [Streptomyces sp. NPDC001508]|uniref:hypothetical protein n=1 Tax=Streptomyces sp. NPDC001508 TaxID=3154656 RepID=UPI003319520C
MSQFRRPLPEASAMPYAQSRHLPPYRGIVAVDAKDFTGYPAIEHGAISQAIPQLLQRSFERAGVAEVWKDRRFPSSTGDGYVFGFDPAWMPYVIHPWLHTLQDVLAEFTVHSTGTVRIRLRVSLHIGPLPDSGGEFDGNGTPRNDTHRLLDSRPVKAMLAASNESITHVAAILSDHCYQDAVASGYTGRHPDHFNEVPATVGAHAGRYQGCRAPGLHGSGSRRLHHGDQERGRRTGTRRLENARTVVDRCHQRAAGHRLFRVRHRPAPPRRAAPGEGLPPTRFPNVRLGVHRGRKRPDLRWSGSFSDVGTQLDVGE